MKRWTKPERCADPAYLHPVLREKMRAVVQDVQGKYDPAKVQFRIFETGRSEVRQQQLVKAKTSKTLHSKHLTGRACDVIPYIKKGKQWIPTWAKVKGNDGRDWTDYLTSSAAAHGLERVWFHGPGGRYVDGPHIQLPASVPDACEGW